jgi:hypothetical protein
LKSLQIDQQTITCSSFEVLPTTLTSLEISETLNRAAESISLRRILGICQLHDLKQLRLYDVTLDTAVLAHLIRSTGLSITSSGMYCSTGRQQLVPISRLTGLHSFHLHRLLRRQDNSSSDGSYVLPYGWPEAVRNIGSSAAEAAAVTASPCLRRLILGEGVAPAVAEEVHSLLHARLHLLQLELVEMYSMGPLISKAAAEQVVSCCPNLQTVCVRTGPSSSLQHVPCVQPAELAGSLKVLGSISSTLTELAVSCPELTVPQAGWQALAALTQLTYLQLNCRAAAMEDVLELTACRSLKHAVLYVCEMDTPYGLHNPLIGGRHALQLARGLTAP